jgi:hypothetical protein
VWHGVGQTDEDPFVVLADPEGNEFCVCAETGLVRVRDLGS